MEINEKGLLPEISEYDGKNYLTTTCLIHFMYDDNEGIHRLREVTIVVVPNGKLQDKYNPSTGDGIWLAGRNALTLGEDFRVRVSFSKLKLKENWCIQTITYDQVKEECKGTWQS